MPDRCCEHLPRPHIPCPWSWEALCCLLTVERCPRSGQRLREATCLSSASAPGPDADRRPLCRPCPGVLAAHWCRGASRAGRHQPAAGLVERRGLDRGRGPRRRGGAARPVPGPPRRPRHRAGGRPRHGVLRRSPHRPGLPAHQRRPGRAAAPVAVHRAAGPPGAQRPRPDRRTHPRPVDHDPHRTAHRLGPRLGPPPRRRRIRPLLPPPPSLPPSPPPPGGRGAGPPAQRFYRSPLISRSKYLSSSHSRHEEGRSAPRSYPTRPPARPATTPGRHPTTRRSHPNPAALAFGRADPAASPTPAPLRCRRLDPPRHRTRPRRRPGHPRLATTPTDQPSGGLPGHPAPPAGPGRPPRCARRVDGRTGAGPARLRTPTDLRPALPARPARRPPALAAARASGLPRLPHLPGHPMRTFTAQAPGPNVPARPLVYRASWAEYQRLLTAGVNPTTAAILATGQPLPDNELRFPRD